MRRLTLLLLTITTSSLALEAGAAAPSYTETVIADARYVLTAPARWDDADWHNAGWVSLAVLGTVAVLDRPWRDEMRRHAGNDPAIRQVERFGAEYAPLVLGGFYLAGMASDNANSKQIAEDGLAASIIASGIISPAIKLVVGRSRPRANVGIAHFKPFNDPNASFPSGHTTEAFALAAVIADHYEADWPGYAAYTLATTVGLARTYHDAHFASDVLLGAVIGTLVGKSVTARNQALRKGQLGLQPAIAPGMVGVRLVSAF